jgi:transposase, IS5 family
VISGQILGASVVQVRRPRLTQDEKATARETARARRRVEGKAGTDEHRRALDHKARPAAEAAGGSAAAITVPVLGYKNHLGIACPHGLICSFAATDAAVPRAATSPATRPPEHHELGLGR